MSQLSHVPAYALARRDKIRRLVKKQGWGALLITSETNVEYLTGFTGDSSFLLVTPTQDVMVSDSRYTTQIEEECGELEKVIRNSGTTTVALLIKTLKSLKVSSITIESQHVTKSFYDQLSQELGEDRVVDSTGVVEEFRAVKDSGELKEIKRSIDLPNGLFT